MHSTVMNALEYIASKLVPSYQGQKNSKYIARENNSSLLLSILVYFNIFYFPVWIIGMLLIIRHKMSYYNPSIFHLVMMNAMFVIHVLIESIRLWLGYSGNLRERVPELAGCFLFGLFPQFVISYYFISLQPFTGDGFALPFEIALNVFYLCFLIPEIILSYLAARHIAKVQTSNFFLKLNDNVEPIQRKHKLDKSFLSWNSLESFW